MQSPLTPCTGCVWFLGESKPPVRISPSSTVQTNPPWEKVSMEGQGLNCPMKREYLLCAPLGWVGSRDAGCCRQGLCNLADGGEKLLMKVGAQWTEKNLERVQEGIWGWGF